MSINWWDDDEKEKESKKKRLFDYLVSLANELGHVPEWSDLAEKRRGDQSLPSASDYAQFWRSFEDVQNEVSWKVFKKRYESKPMPESSEIIIRRRTAQAKRIRELKENNERATAYRKTLKEYLWQRQLTNKGKKEEGEMSETITKETEQEIQQTPEQTPEQKVPAALLALKPRQRVGPGDYTKNPYSSEELLAALAIRCYENGDPSFMGLGYDLIGGLPSKSSYRKCFGYSGIKLAPLVVKFLDDRDIPLPPGLYELAAKAQDKIDRAVAKARKKEQEQKQEGDNPMSTPSPEPNTVQESKPVASAITSTQGTETEVTKIVAPAKPSEPSGPTISANAAECGSLIRVELKIDLPDRENPILIKLEI